MKIKDAYFEVADKNPLEKVIEFEQDVNFTHGLEPSQAIVSNIELDKELEKEFI